MKATEVKFLHKQAVFGIGPGVDYVKLGQPCVGAFGGGVVAELVIDRDLQMVIIRKRNAAGERVGFVPLAGASNVKAWDATGVPLVNVKSITLVDDPKPAQPEVERPAQPAQQQGQQGRERR